MKRQALRQWLSPRGAAASRSPGRTGTDTQPIVDSQTSTPTAGASADRPPARLLPSNAPMIMDWRSPWWGHLTASWVLTTATTPTFAIVGLLLAIDPRSSHPAFWPALMAMVALVHGVSILRTNQRHHRQPYVCREAVARDYNRMSRRLGISLFLVIGWCSGFLPDMSSAMGLSHDSPASAAREIFWNVLLACLFSLVSFTHSGAIHARLGFEHRRYCMPA